MTVPIAVYAPGQNPDSYHLNHHAQLLTWLVETGRITPPAGVPIVAVVPEIHVHHSKRCRLVRGLGPPCNCEPSIVWAGREWTWAHYLASNPEAP